MESYLVPIQRENSLRNEGQKKSKENYKTREKISGNYETYPQYLKYVKLLRQYFEIKNNEEKLQSKFNEIIAQHQKLVQAGILVLERRD